MEEILFSEAKIENDTPINHYFGRLSEDRKQYVIKANNDDVKNQRICSSYLLESLLQEYYEISQPIRYGIEENGKPYLKDYQNIYFSISHSGSFVACAISKYPVGIDIEDIKRPSKNNWKKVVLSRFFSKEERDELLSLNSYSDFLRCWTFKEAMAKALDRPLSEVLSDYSTYRYKNPDCVRTFVSKSRVMTIYSAAENNIFRGIDN